MIGAAARLRTGGPLLLDGGLGSLLIARGLPAGTPPEAWVLERPDAIAAAHRDYVAAGTEAVHTCTFGANPVRLAAHGLADRCAEINALAVRIAREAGAALVVADVGPTGEYLPPVGRADVAAWRAAFAAQARALAAAGPDAFHVETMSDLREARVALEAILESSPGATVFVSLTFERRRRGFFTVLGDPLVASLRALAAGGAAAVGANCSIASADMRALAAEAIGAVGAPVVVQPNAGAPRAEDGVLRYEQPPEAFADDVAAIAGLGARAVGGCCGTDPRFVAALAARLKDGAPP